MKQEATKKSKLWLWIVIGVVALLAVAGVVLALVMGGQGETKTPGGRPELYWNVDKLAYTENSETGLSTRQPGEDGLYHVRFAKDGQLVEFAVADKPLINFIDTLDAMGLVFDADGVIVDVVNAKDIATEKTKNAYVKQIMGADKIIANSSVAMNGMNININLCDLSEIYDVTPGAEQPGKIITTADLKPMDVLTVYCNDLEEVTHVYLTSHPKESKVYWRADQFYSSSEKSTTRVPDENGVYTIPFFCEGETVELKFKDKALVTKIDSASRWKCHYGLTFDEEGYVIEQYVSSLGIGGIIVADCWDIVEINGDEYTIQRLTTNDGSVWTGTIPADCVIYDASAAGKADKRGGQRLEGLQMGDRVTVWTDTSGNVILVYVSNRIVDSPAYFVTTRKYSSSKKESTRKIGDSGYYEVELIKEGTNFKDIYYIKDKATVDYFDSLTDKVVGLKLSSGKIIESVYNTECLTGYTTATRGGIVTSSNGTILTKVSYGKRGTETNLVLAAGARVYNVSQVGTLGAETTIQPGDHIYAHRQPTGELLLVYVTKRETGANTLYWNLKLMYDSTAKESTRVPDEEGWYHFEMAMGGKVYNLKTKNKEIVNYIDSQSIGAVGLTVSGDVITQAFDPTYAYTGNKVASGYRFDYVTGEGKYHCYYNSDNSKTVEFVMADDCVIYNVSSVFTEFKGEKLSKIPQDAMLTVFCDEFGEAKVVYVRAQSVENMYWKTETMYDSTNKVTKRVPDADGYYWFDVAVNGERKTIKTKDKAIADSMDSYYGAFGLNMKGDEAIGFVSTSNVMGVSGNGVNGYCVTKIEGNKVTLTYNKPGSSFGKTEVITLSSKTKIYRVTPGCTDFGKEVKLEVGDTVRTYLSKDGKTHSYVYVMAKSTRKGGETGWCDVCKQNVTWNPLLNSTTLTTQTGHWYLTEDMTSAIQQTHGTSSRDYTICLDLNGHTLTRMAPGRMFRIYKGETLNIFDSVGGGKIVTNGGANFSGGMIMISEGGKVNLYSGTLEYVTTEYKSGGGGIVYVSGSGSEFNMHGGELVGGWAEKGGNIYGVSSAVVNIYDGVIRDGKVNGKLVETVNADGTVTYKLEDSQGGNIALTESASANILGGTITGGEAVRDTYTYEENGETKSVSNLSLGGNISKLNGTGTVVIKNAVISDGTARRGGNIYATGCEFTVENTTISGGVCTQFGGNIMTTGGTWNIKDSKIEGGSGASTGGNIYSQGGVYTLTGTTVTGGQATSGGNIYLYKNKTADNIFNIGEGTVVENGVATQHGGNIYVKNKNYDDADGNPLLPTLNITGGKVINGVCDSEATGSYYGGNIYLAGHMNVSGGLISGGLQGTTDYEIYIPGENTQNVVISGGTIVGKLRVNGPKSLVIEGNPNLGQLNLRNTKITVGELTDGAQITVLSNTEIFSLPCDKAQQYLDAGFFTAFDAEKSIGITSSNELTVSVPKIIKWCDICSQNVEWQPYEGNDVGAGYNGDNIHLFLPDGGYEQTYGQIDIQGTVTLDLNGQTLVGKEGKRLWKIEGVFNIIDSVGGGRVETKCNPTGGGGIAMCRKNPNTGDKPVINLYAGTLTTHADAVNASSAGILNMNGDTTLNMYGGTIEGGKADTGAQNIAVSTGTFNMSGGFIDGGITASSSANITLSGTAKIAATNNGLDISSGAKIKVEAMTDAEIYITGNAGAFTDVIANADEYIDNFKTEAENFEISNVGGALTLVDDSAPVDPNTICQLANAMSFANADADGKVTAKCPVCQKTVEWKALPANTTGEGMKDLGSGHYYLSENIDYTQNNGLYNFTKMEICLHLNGQTLTTTERAFYNENAAAVLNVMGDGTISGAGYMGTGTNAGKGNGVFDLTAKTNFYGGTIISTGKGPAIGNRKSSSGDALISIYAGTTVINENADGYALYVSHNGSIAINGGTINGKVYDNASKGITVSGAPVISDLDLSNGSKITVGALTEGADITVTATDVFTNELTAPADYIGFFKAAAAGKGIIVTDSALAIGEVREVVCPHCGMTEAELAAAGTPWTPWTAAYGSTTKGTIATGHYYLTESVLDMTGYYYAGASANDTPDVGVDIVLDMRGFSLKSTTRVFYGYQNSNLTLMDSVGGSYISGGLSTSAGGTIFFGDGTKAEDGDTAKLAIYDVDVIDGATKTREKNGGVLFTSGSTELYIENATITGLTAQDGVALCMSSGNTTFVNCTINGGAASSDGGAICMTGAGTLVLENTTVVDGTAPNGPGVCAKEGTVKLTNSTANSILLNSAATIEVAGTTTIAALDLTSGAKITKAELTTDAEITVIADGVFTADLTDAAAAKDFFKSGVADKLVLVEGAALAIGVETTPEETTPEEPTDKSIYEQAKEMDFTAGGTVTAKCPVCGTEVAWEPLSAIGPHSTAGKENSLRINDGAEHHYYLDSNTDYTQNGGYYAVATKSKVCLNLNGQTIVSVGRAFYTESEGTVLNIMGEGSITGAGIVNTTNKNFCGVIDATSQVNLYGGTWTASNEVSVISVRGSKAYCIVNMYEGTSLVRTADGAQGNLVYVCDNGEFNMYGGEIIGGTGVANANISADLKYGGNILVRAAISTTGAYTADVNIYGGTISGGVAENKGGNIAVWGSGASSHTATLNVSGGQIVDGDIFVTGTGANFNVSGNPVIDYVETVDANLLNVGELTEGASIKVNAAKDVAFTAPIAANAETYATYFATNDLYQGVVVKDGALVLTDICPHCGVAMADIEWKEITLVNGTPLTESGHFYLTQDYEGFTKQVSVNGVGADIVLDMKGHTLTSSGRGFYVGAESSSVGVTFSLLDTVGTAKVTTTYGTGGGVLYVITKSGTPVNTLNVYGGTYQNIAAPTGGGCVRNNLGCLNIYAGTFNGAQMSKGKGGCVYITSGETNIYGGTFTAGKADAGEGFYVEKSAVVNLAGGNIGGQFYVAAADKITVSGAPVIENLELAEGKVITLGALTEGADITVTANGAFTVESADAQTYLEFFKATEGTITAENGVLTVTK